MDENKNIRAFFEQDHFAASLGIGIDSIEGGAAVCSVELASTHCNADGFVQGGLIFTLADFTFAVAANAMNENTVTLAADIHYLRPATAGRLTATARCMEQTRTICLYNVTVADDTGDLIAQSTMTGFIKRRK